jgi:hypothetical protein
MFSFFKELFEGHNSNSKFTQNEKEATIELLIVAMYADSIIRIDEEELIQEQFSSLNWDSHETSDLFISRSIGHIRTTLDDETALETLTNSICSRLQSKHACVHANQLLDQLLAAKELSSEAIESLNKLKDLVKISAE